MAHGESLPAIDNRIELSGTRDAGGSPRVRVVHEFDADAKAISNHAKTEGAAIMRAAGAGEVFTSGLGSTHMMGGTVMGSDPERSVTDAYGRVHSMDNLYIAGSGLFPTAGAVNPTFSIYALSLRNAEHLAKHGPG